MGPAGAHRKPPWASAPSDASDQMKQGRLFPVKAPNQHGRARAHIHHGGRGKGGQLRLTMASAFCLRYLRNLHRQTRQVTQANAIWTLVGHLDAAVERVTRPELLIAESGPFRRLFWEVALRQALEVGKVPTVGRYPNAASRLKQTADRDTYLIRCVTCRAACRYPLHHTTNSTAPTSSLQRPALSCKTGTIKTSHRRRQTIFERAPTDAAYPSQPRTACLGVAGMSRVRPCS